MAGVKRSTTLIVTGVGGVVAAALLVGLMLVLLSSGDVKSRLGDPTYDAGNAEAFARRADEQPVLLPALVGFQRDILVSHIGRDEWRAFEANPPGRGRRCQVRWRATTRDFRAPCTGAVYPLDGAGLKQYSATVNKAGRLIIDLRAEVTTTTVTPTTTTPTTTTPTTVTPTTAR
jgi:hypothetical protein